MDGLVLCFSVFPNVTSTVLLFADFTRNCVFSEETVTIKNCFVLTASGFVGSSLESSQSPELKLARPLLWPSLESRLDSQGPA